MKYEEILKTRVNADVVERSFTFGEKMLNKYVDFNTVMRLTDCELDDIRQVYALADAFKNQMITAIKQQNQQSEMLYDLTLMIKELSNEVTFLQEEIDSLKSKAEKDD